MITEFSVDVDTLNLSDSKSLPVIRVSGEIDIYTCSELRKTLASTIESSATDFLLNLENVQYIDSTGLGTIAHSAQQIQTNNGQVFIICTKPQIKKIFEVSGLLSKNISIYESEDQISVPVEN
ncbi:hypothetical protein CL647_04380 [bacterium]|mgnify:CR=1 FL=1|nr:hypothetical protein [Actinomycetota bacterium]MBE33338.1 hypothetical protein [bacterium]|tara:strand:+ start:5184 stop:5552 length:369 start_codon:yes stop_codon:yes gene_type:complete